MRIPPPACFHVIGALLCLGTFAAAEEQDRKLMERLTRPNMSLEYNTNQSTFGTPGSFSTKSSTAGKQFGGTRSFMSREYLAKAYGGTEKRSWLGSLFFSAKSANTSGKYEIPNASQKYDARTASTKEALGYSRAANTTAFLQAEQPYLKRNNFDTSLKLAPPQGGKTPLGYTGDLRPMSIDDVRDLLNKNK